MNFVTEKNNPSCVHFPYHAERVNKNATLCCLNLKMWWITITPGWYTPTYFLERDILVWFVSLAVEKFMKII